MSLVISDRVKETTTTTGTGTVTLGGALGGFQTFSDAIGTGNTTYYVIENDAQYEIGIGTCGGDSLSRDTVLRSSNSDAKISLTGVSFVFCVIPADRSIFKDVDGNFIISGDISNLIISYDENDYDMIKNLSLKENIVEKSDYKFAFVKGPAWPKGDEDMKENFEDFISKSKLNITEITLPESFDNALQNHEIIMNGGIYSSLKKVYKEDKENLHPYTINRIENGLNLNASDYVDAIENAKKMKFDLSTIFEKFDAIITPAAPGEAPRDLSTTGNAMFNGYWTMMGVPAISLPLLTGENSLPIGVQVITSWQNDNLLLKISDEILKDYQ